jgi:hypothetical protein
LKKEKNKQIASSTNALDKTLSRKPVSNNNLEKSILDPDVTRKINAFMDFSIILNKNNHNDETNYNELLGNKTQDIIKDINNDKHNIWDISCINKN